MRVSSLMFLALPVIWAAEAHSQDATDEAQLELYCEQCPFDAPVRVPAPNVFSPPATISPTATRDLGFISVRDMIDQLPDNIARVPLEDIDGFELRGIDTEGAQILILVDGEGIPETASGESESVAPADSGEEELNADPDGAGQN